MCKERSDEGGLDVVQEGQGLRDFGKRFTNFLGVNRFSNFYTRLSGQRKLFVIGSLFYNETNSRKSENIFRKIFYTETNGA